MMLNTEEEKIIFNPANILCQTKLTSTEAYRKSEQIFTDTHAQNT